MIGVVCGRHEEELAEEFFEFFKTPWEFYKAGRKYRVVISTAGCPKNVQAELLILYGSDTSDDYCRGVLSASSTGTYVDCENVTFPIYGKLLTFDVAQRPLAQLHGSSAAVALELDLPAMQVVRAGYDLFHELHVLLSLGQPVSNALTPTVEIHIAMLRNWILRAGISLVEIPPVPASYDFIVCLTHDVDFLRIKDHKLDHTLLGFIKRATVGSLRRWLKRALSGRHFLQNLKAVFSLPAVYLGIRKDFWLEDFDRFLELERDLRATFFFIPFKDRPGDKVRRTHWNRRAAAYDVTQEQALLKKLMDRGHEIGVHGIDAWHDPGRGREEYRRIADAAGVSNLGIRMHWLCFDFSSPEILEKAGFQYDATVGYNETVGCRTGTLQVFRPCGATTLLELPLHIQDTALFSEGHLNLSQSEAWKLTEALVNNAAAYGGVLTILWHTRSLAPERQWGDFYVRLLETLKARRIWFATAGEVVDWFRKRRSFSFRGLNLTERRDDDTTPNLLLRLHGPDRSFMDTECFISGECDGENMHDHLQRVCL